MSETLEANPGDVERNPGENGEGGLNVDKPTDNVLQDEKEKSSDGEQNNSKQTKNPDVLMPEQLPPQEHGFENTNPVEPGQPQTDGASKPPPPLDTKVDGPKVPNELETQQSKEADLQKNEAMGSGQTESPPNSGQSDEMNTETSNPASRIEIPVTYFTDKSKPNDNNSAEPNSTDEKHEEQNLGTEKQYETPSSPTAEPSFEPSHLPLVDNDQDNDIPREVPEIAGTENIVENKMDFGPAISFVIKETIIKEVDNEWTKSDQKGEEKTEQDKKIPEPTGQKNHVVFVEISDQSAIEDILRNCETNKEEFPIEENLKGARKEYNRLLSKAKESGCEKEENLSPPSELSFVTDTEKNQAPLLYGVITSVSEKVPSYSRWKEAVTEFIGLTTLSQSEPKTPTANKQHMISVWPKTKQVKPKKPQKNYNNTIEMLLDQDWGSDRAPPPSVVNEYRHLFTCQCVLKSSFPEADIFAMADSTIKNPNDVPKDLQHKALFHFLLSVDERKVGVEYSQIWRDYGRLVLAEKQWELAKKAQGPDLHTNVLVSRLDFYKMQNELKEKSEEVEELSTRLSRFASQQLTEGNPNIADLSDSHRPTRLGEMYSQLFDDEWSEAFEAFKPQSEDEDDDIFPDTLHTLQNLLTSIFEFCQKESEEQKIFLDDSFALAIGLKDHKVLRTNDATTHTDSTASRLEEKGETEDTSSSDKGKTPEVDDKYAEGGGDSITEPTRSTPVKEEEVVETDDANTPKAEDKPDKKDDTEHSNEEENKSTGQEQREPKPDNNEQETENSKPVSQAESSEIPQETSTDETEKVKDANQDDQNPETGDNEKVEAKAPKKDENKKEEPENVDENNKENNSENDKNENVDQSKEGESNLETPNAKTKDPSDQAAKGDSEARESIKEDKSNADNQEKDESQKPSIEDTPPETKDYRKNPIYPTIDRHARDFKKAAASTSAKTKYKLFIQTGLPSLIADETVRADVRVLTYVRRCVELCWYMCMQDPPMVIIAPKQGDLVDKNLFSFHGRRGKIVQVCVWPALLLHDNGPLVCKGYVLPEERGRKR